MKILLIEPDLFLGKIYKHSLERNGDNVIWAKGAQQAVAFADENKPDIVVLEIQLPKHNGIEFLYEFRSYPEWQNVPIILHTLSDFQSMWAETFNEIGVIEFLYKPTTSLKKLVNSVERVLTGI